LRFFVLKAQTTEVLILRLSFEHLDSQILLVQISHVRQIREIQRYVSDELYQLADNGNGNLFTVDLILIPFKV
jgi:hypothetical protein